MDRFYIWILVTTFLTCVYASIKITELRVPESIAIDGNVTDAEFDCIYEVKNETGLEVKWFFNGDYHQIYQWVPGFGKKGSPMGMLKNHTDLLYVVTNDSDTEYRGFKITNISQELSGNYTCKISSDTDEASATKQMIIYSPADSGLNIMLLNSEGLVVCTAYGISPMPEVDFYILAENGTQLDLHETFDASEADDDGLYNITATHDFSEYNHTLKGPTKFVCNMSIPGTSYFLTKELVHLADIHNEEPVQEEEKAKNVGDVSFNQTEIVARNQIPLEIVVEPTAGGNSAVHLTVLIYAMVLPVSLLFWK